ncbi:glutamate dehydrogenase [Streptomyces antioxidans]|uniref:Glutamate dehydrogenase n=1 Tax=Streptomyces antioxidans TaxID=1507734 RepID=A0A1V4DBR8_9ACTN|nr:Glu/Leu/Phe/Val dehydrogenase dimerization domain-containing protein [Streptomyces antioxidans]OPF83716.1 glutamate dehydrogenase [Streptomyces antioxidans]
MSDELFSLIDDWGPEKIVCVSDSRTRMRGVLVLDNTARGTGKGGTRMGPAVTVTEIARLARTMTWKWAAVDLFHGGAKAGIVADPHADNKEAVLRAFARALSNEVPREYVLGLDMGLSEPDAAIFLDELGDRGASVGLPTALGGLPYDELGVTGFGVAEAADAAAGETGLRLAGARVVIQGFGAVGTAAAARFAELGATVVAVSTTTGAVYAPDGLDIERLRGLHAELGEDCVRAYGGKQLDAGAELAVDTDVLVPAATQDVIDPTVARDVTARLVVEGANLPTTPEARLALSARGITVVPDFIANAGGVVAAAYAMDARYSAFRPELEQVFASISDKLRSNVATVLERSRALKVSTHQAALQQAQDRVREAMRLRGRLPVTQGGQR